MADEEYFNHDYVEVDRVLEKSVTVDPFSEEQTTHFLVKWRSLSYEESTWELEGDVDQAKVADFDRFNILPTEEQMEVRGGGGVGEGGGGRGRERGRERARERGSEGARQGVSVAWWPSDGACCLQYVERPLPNAWTRLEESPAFKNANKLREYQLEGVNWLMFSYCNR